MAWLVENSAWPVLSVPSCCRPLGRRLDRLALAGSPWKRLHNSHVRLREDEILRCVRWYPKESSPTNLENTTDLNIHQGSWGFLKKSSQGWKSCLWWFYLIHLAKMFTKCPCRNSTNQNNPKTSRTQDWAKHRRGGREGKNKFKSYENLDREHDCFISKIYQVWFLQRNN